MAFWKQDKPLPISNKQQLNATQQQKILREAKLGAQDISKIKKAGKASGLLNPNKRISLNTMKKLLKDQNPKVAGKVDRAFNSYQKKAKEFVDDFCQEQYDIDRARADVKEIRRTKFEASDGDDEFLNEMEEKEEKVRENIKKTRKFDTKRRRSEEYSKERAAERGWSSKISSSALHKGSSKDSNVSASSWSSSKNTVSASRWDTKNKSNKRGGKGAASISDFEKLKKDSSNLPDLPI